MSAPHTATGSLVECLGGLTEAVKRLAGDFGVTVEWGDIGDDVGRWEHADRRLTINLGAPLEDQAWIAGQAWNLCAIGQHAVPASRPMGSLRLVKS